LGLHRKVAVLKKSKYRGWEKATAIETDMVLAGANCVVRRNGQRARPSQAPLGPDHGYLQWDQRNRLGPAGPALQFVVWLDFSAPSHHDPRGTTTSFHFVFSLKQLLFKRGRQRSRPVKTR
jgi:hypothetical protein